MFTHFSKFLSVLLQGVLPTVELTVLGIILCTIMSFVFGLAMLSSNIVVRFVARVYVEGWRGTSEVVQLFWIYFALPILVGIQFIPLFAGVIVLGLNMGAYGAEFVRGAVQSVPKEQYEGCIALSLTPAQRMRRVILPQAIPEMLPPFNNLFIQLLKATAIVEFINVSEITYQGENVLRPAFGSPNQVLLIFLMMLVMYLILSVLITIGMRFLERSAGRMVGRRPQRNAKGRNRQPKMGDHVMWGGS
ncbi:MAG: ectoine/hydroxyectoine ABC transporter permease subunit EhuC [Sciscionella sp.]